MNKKKGHRSQVKKGYYERQKAKTEANKHRRAAKRVKKAAYWKKRKADELHDKAMQEAIRANQTIGTVPHGTLQ